MAFVVHVVGWRESLPGSDRWSCLRLPPNRLDRARSLLLLGDAAPSSTSPAGVRAWLSAGPRRALFSPARVRIAELADWLDGGAIELVPRERLLDTIDLRARELELGFVPWPLEPEDWLPQGLAEPTAGSLADRALRLLPRVRPLHGVRHWSRSLGFTSHWQLRRQLRAALNCTPRELVQLHLLAQVRAADADGVSREDLAVLLGYADASALRHGECRALTTEAQVLNRPGLRRAGPRPPTGQAHPRERAEAETPRRGDAETRRRGDAETRRRGDAETRRRGDDDMRRRTVSTTLKRPLIACRAPRPGGRTEA